MFFLFSRTKLGCDVVSSQSDFQKAFVSTILMVLWILLYFSRFFRIFLSKQGPVIYDYEIKWRTSRSNVHLIIINCEYDHREVNFCSILKRDHFPKGNIQLASIWKYFSGLFLQKQTNFSETKRILVCMRENYKNNWTDVSCRNNNWHSISFHFVSFIYINVDRKMLSSFMKLLAKPYNRNFNSSWTANFESSIQMFFGL